MTNALKTLTAAATTGKATPVESSTEYATYRAQKKVGKLKKSRLWPSIVFFIISLLIGSLLLGLELGIFVSHIIETKYTSELSSTQDVASNVDGLLQAGKSPQAALNEIAQYLDDSSQLFIADDSGKVLGSIGKITIDTQHGALMTIEKDEEIFRDGTAIADASAIRNMLKKRNRPEDVIAQDLYTAVQEQESSIYYDLARMFDPDNIGKETLVEYVYWQSEPLPATGDRLFIKNHIAIQEDDIFFSVAFIVVSGLMFLIIITVQFANVIRQLRLRRRIERLLMTDIITGGNNWYGFEENGWKVLGKKGNAGKAFAVVNLSLEKYQSYCLLHGTKAGEQLLAQIDHSLSAAIGNNEICAHMNGADFALFLNVGEGERGQANAMERISALLSSFAHSGSDGTFCIVQNCPNMSKLVFRAGVCFVDPSVTAGKTKAERRQINLSDYYTNAGIAKDSLPAGEGGVAQFNRKMLDDQLWQHKIESSMQAALDNREFSVYVQPKYNPNTEQLEGGEALVRWVSPTEGMISPGRFIPIFEKTGFITKLDDYMISSVAALQSTWLAEGKSIVPVSVNVSRAHFAQPNLAEHICGLVDAYGLPHEYIEIELTESAFFDDKRALLETVDKLHKLGFLVSMDDFGSGYSSLNSLKDLPLDVLKLDAGFFRGDDFDTRGEIVVSEAIALAKKLNMKIVAEGIEKKDQVEFLAMQDCDMIQGYYYAKPMPANEYAERLSSKA